MHLRLLADMVCPYCLGNFVVARNVRGDSERVDYGLIECRCFTFPVVAGIPLLSLSKGYGGAEEELQPYVPLQVAAVEYLGRGDVAGLLHWVGRHAPFAAELISGTADSYVAFTGRLNAALAEAERSFLIGQGRYEVVGYPQSLPRRVVAEARHQLRRRLAREDGNRLPAMDDYYAARFASPRVSAMALQCRALPAGGRVLSLCCGHGVFETVVDAQAIASDVVSMDGQFLNLLITRRYADHGGTYICHDLQYPLPFRDGAFDGVFSSTCLPEIPAQQTFAREAIRATSPRGWTLFDSIWNLEMGVFRISRGRHYRFCQNFFRSLDDYLPMFEACAGPDRTVAVDVADAPAAYVAGPRWTVGEAAAKTVTERSDDEISIAVLGPDFPGFATPDHSWLTPGRVGVSLAYDVARRDGVLDLRLRPEFATLNPNFAPKQFPGYAPAATIELARLSEADYLLAEFVTGRVALVPGDFSDDAVRAGLARASAGPGARP